MRKITVLSVVLMLVFTTVAAASAQTGGICPGVVDQALAQLGTNCAGMDRNSACYGFNNVVADFNVPVPSSFFTVTNDRAELLTIDSIETGELDLSNDEYGVSLLSVQANLPGTLPGQGTVFVLVGGTKVQDAVSPSQAVVPGTTAQLTTTADTELRTYPNTGAWSSSDVVGSVATGTTVTADAIDPTGGWVRVVANGAAGWINLAAASGDTSGLTTVSPTSKSPMQAFFFRTGIGGVTCDDVPSVLAVQGPQNASVDITAQGVNVRIMSTIVLQTLPPGANPPTSFQLTTLSGLAIIYPDTPNAIYVPAGFSTTIALGPVGPDGFSQQVVGNWSPLRPITQDEIDQLRKLSIIPANVLNYVPGVPILVQASGVGSTLPQLIFPNPAALEAARNACANGLIPAAVCQIIGF
jgi:uncharacterized protein YgiM (DUF1202 family)